MNAHPVYNMIFIIRKLNKKKTIPENIHFILNSKLRFPLSQQKQVLHLSSTH